MPTTHSNHAPEIQSFLGALQNSDSRLAEGLRRALKNDLTDKQYTALLLYYGGNLTMEEVGQRLGVGRSTVSRHIRSATGRLRKYLKYGARELLFSTIEEDAI